ncbi:GNAT family N-acetyltransferase [Moheibacter sediminis]|uniref:Acetyltransferase (GNAT) family protein n=1 Tax=Moheibacter sediminis TaxID=1434700 RepID=A0A1W1YLZ1_9FLAO|nr:GNAT family N-acetyltransferase [Moheibacter sediminis]SMC37197.1 Acetyltransferase (GNAT) family protein [Moheibacter sediminis]
MSDNLIIQRTNSENKDFQKLVSELDAYLAIRNGDENDFFVQFNQIDLLKHVVLIYQNEIPVGCGAIKEYYSNVMEIKRMFVPQEFRGRGIAQLVLKELENWAKELGFEKCILETGEDMKDAVGLYQKSNYKIIPNYGQYKDVETSICFEKIL